TRNAMRDVTVAALCRVWFAANRHTTDGVFKNANLDYLDTLAQVPGFGEAMAQVGYAIHDPETNTVTLPRFEEYNAPDKNGQRSKTAGAIRQEKYRAKKAAQAAQPPPVPPQQPQSSAAENKKSDVTSDVTRDVTPSISSSSSISESESGTQTQKPETSTPPAAPEPLSLDELKKRINALRPKTWGRAPHWSNEDESALFEARANFQGLDEQDWLLLQWFMQWASTAANTSQKDPVKVTTRRHTFCTELPAYLDRAATAWKQAGSPKLSPTAPSTPRSKLPATPVLDQSIEEAKKATAALRASLTPGAQLLQDLGIPIKPSPLPTTTAAA
ncbi:MAG: hypothetical protein J0L73_28400, partial [Verrucomicrobia bacterium]|nr:hypothetical protein [Verrucomicrobiota bacterium]